jgi:hypothetical protein
VHGVMQVGFACMQSDKSRGKKLLHVLVAHVALANVLH